MKSHVALLACVALIAGCNKQPQVNEKDASVAEVAKKVRDSGAEQSFVQPGRWESKITIDEFTVPGMPADIAARMKKMMAQQQEHSFTSCLTKEDVQRPKEDFFTGKDNECRYDHFTMGGGKIDAAMHCGDESRKQTMRMAGTYSPTNYQMQMSTKVEGGGEMQDGTTMRMRVDAKRVGECTGKEDA